MGKIRVLPDVLASQVAAGEVVERPASVIKELVENSLDAGATLIDIRADRGGVALMRVRDDGCGMSREDAILSLERHATSKLRSVADLGAIRTLGFRGEALPSIASVSRFTLQTREPHALAGTEVNVDGGRLLDVRDWGGAPGTLIEVRSLFANVPARRKFVRSENTESGHIEQTVRVQALAHPETGFTLVRDGRLIFQLAPRVSSRVRIEGLVGSDLAARLIECPPGERSGLRIHGWIGAAGCTRADRSLTLVFVNGRPVESPVLNYALRSGYGDQLGRGQHPLCFLFVEIDPAAVDVNVHPAKKEIRFRDGLSVQAVIAGLVQEALRIATAPRDSFPMRAGVLPAPAPTPSIAPADSAPVRAPQKPASLEHVASSVPPVSAAFIGSTARQMKLPAPAAADPHAESPARAGPKPYRLIGVLKESYALLEGDEGLVLMEIRAAHERVLFEDLRRQLAAGTVPAQALLIPLTVQLTPRDFALAREFADPLRRLGFGIEEFGANTVKMETLPSTLDHSDPAAFLSGLLDDLAHAGDAGARSRIDTEALAAAVCNRALPRDNSLAPEEIHALLDRLLACDMPYCDPSGRPTLIQTSFHELARKFGRKM